MHRVLCLDDGTEYLFKAKNGYAAILNMLYTLNLSHRDNEAVVELCNDRTWCLTHNGKTYACLK